MEAWLSSFFSSRRRHTRCGRDWSSDVCSSDLNKKVIVFTAFADTAIYLYREISDWALSNYGLHSALIKGSGSNKTNFPEARSEERRVGKECRSRRWACE